MDRTPVIAAVEMVLDRLLTARGDQQRAPHPGRAELVDDVLDHRSPSGSSSLGWVRASADMRVAGPATGMTASAMATHARS